MIRPVTVENGRKKLSAKLTDDSSKNLLTMRMFGVL